MSRPSWLKAVIGTLAACLFSAVALAQPAPPTFGTPTADAMWARPPGAKPANEPDLNQFCANAGATPLCAMKTYLACALYDAPAMCAAVGLEGVPERYPGPDTLDTDVLAAPWALPIERVMPDAFALHLYNGGFVPPERFGAAHFDTTRGNAPPPITGPGIYELVLDIPEPYVNGLVYRLSAFFRQTGSQWRMIAWSSSRAKACDAGAGTAAWSMCRWFLKDLKQRDVFAPDVTQVWASAKPPGRDDYPHPGLELMMGLPNQPVVAPFAGTIVRRALKYPDVPLYDWVVIEGRDRQANMTVKLAMVDRTGPAAGTAIEAAAPLGRPQWVEGEHPGAGRFVHIELLRNGQQIDPRSVMRERKVEDPAPSKPQN